MSRSLDSINSYGISGSAQLIRSIERAETLRDSEKMHKLQAANASCLTCNHTKTALGARLVCNHKGGKLVSSYNLCTSWHAIKITRK